MAKKYVLTDKAAVTITNKADQVNVQSYTGERVNMTLAEAKQAGFTDWEFVLDLDGNFVTAADVAVSENSAPISDENVVVTVRQAVLNTDRFIQFYRTQQQIKLAAGDSITIPVKSIAEYAFYAGYEKFEDLAVVSEGVIEEDA